MNRLTKQRRINFTAIATVGFYAVIAYASTSAVAQEDDGLLAARNLQKAFVSAIERAEKSVVSIARFKSVGVRRVGSAMPPEGAIPNEFGSGVLITNDKGGREPLVLTNYHLVRGGQTAGKNIAGKNVESGGSDILVRFHDRHQVRAFIIAADPRSDLAVLKLKLVGSGVKPSSLIPFKLGTAATFRKGQLVVYEVRHPQWAGLGGQRPAKWHHSHLWGGQ